MDKRFRPKTVRFYPVLPRSPRSAHRSPRVSGGISSRKCIYQKVIHFNQLHKPTGLFEPDKGDFRSTVELNVDTTSLTKNPGWKVTVAKHGDATSAYSRNITSVSVPMYSCYSESANYRSQGYGKITKAPIITEKSYTPLINTAVGQIVNKLNGHVGKAELAAPIAESREIHRMLRQINSLALDSVKALIAIKKTKGKSAFKHAANIWLGLNFGVNPLLKDIESAANSISDYNSRMDHFARLTGTATFDWTSNEISPADQFGEQIATGMRVGYARSINHMQGVRIVAGVDIKTRSTASYSVTDHLGLKLSALPSTLWELTPFSWAVDYFTTVSPWLDDMFYTLPGNTTYVSQSMKYQSECTTDLLIWKDVGFSGYLSGGRSIVKFVRFNRVKLSQLPSRSLYIKSVDQVASHSLSKLLNLTSVLAQMRIPNL